MPRVPIDPSRTALIFFDMLNCYVHPPDAEKERRILDIIEEMRKLVLEENRNGR